MVYTFSLNTVIAMYRLKAFSSRDALPWATYQPVALSVGKPLKLQQLVKAIRDTSIAKFQVGRMKL